jgi:hypothetical protein
MSNSSPPRTASSRSSRDRGVEPRPDRRRRIYVIGSDETVRSEPVADHLADLTHGTRYFIRNDFEDPSATPEGS